MQHSSLARLAASITIASFVAVGLGGCFALPFLPHRPSASPTSTPKEHKADKPTGSETGDCWEATYRNMAEWSNWEGDGPVPCDERHQSYTYLSTAFDGDVSTPYDADGMTVELQDATSDQCDRAFDDQFDWGDKAPLIGVYFFVPTQEEWDAGNHTIRCDIGLLAIGSDYLQPKLEDLPDTMADLASDIKENPEAYGLCVIGNGAGPYESRQTELVNCGDGDYYWRYGGTVDYPAGASIPFPDDKTLNDYANDECPSLGIESGESVLSYNPSADSWAAGDRTIQCWFSLVEEPAGSV